MSEEELVSPPFPGEGTTTELQYERLKELKEWVGHYRDELNQHAGNDVVPKVKAFLKREVYATQPVLTQFQHFMTMRHIRESWDELVRDYEDAWNSKAAIRRRMLLVNMAATMLNEAFIPFEVREAHQERNLERMNRRFKHLRRYMDQILSSAGDDEGDTEEDDDNDA